VIRLNLPPTEAGNAWLERLAWIVPLAAIPAGFLWSLGFMAPGQSRGWLAARLTLATLVGLNVCLFHIACAIDYRDSRNSGVLGVWAIGVVAGLVAFVGSAIVAAVMLWRGRPSGASPARSDALQCSTVRNPSAILPSGRHRCRTIARNCDASSSLRSYLWCGVEAGDANGYRMDTA